MEFDWRRAIDRNCEELCALAARLIVMAGIQAGRKAETLPRHLYWRILALLRPAEFAARRLIAMAACKLAAITVLPSKGRGARPQNSVIPGPDPKTSEAPSLLARTHSVKPEPPAKTEKEAPYSILVSLREAHGVGPRVKPEDDARREIPRPAVHTARGAAFPAFALFDPFKRYGHPWLEPDDLATPDTDSFRVPLPPDEPVDAKGLCRRIRALAGALSDLEGQALRLARWRARRSNETCRPKRWSPIRPGRPPGWRKRPKTQIEAVLKECHLLAKDAWNTS